MKDVVVLIDREQGGEAHLAANGLRLHAAFKLAAMLDVLTKHGLVSDETAGKVRAFIAENQTTRPAAAPAAAPAKPKRCAGAGAGARGGLAARLRAQRWDDEGRAGRSVGRARSSTNTVSSSLPAPPHLTTKCHP